MGKVINWKNHKHPSLCLQLWIKFYETFQDCNIGTSCLTNQQTIEGLQSQKKRRHFNNLQKQLEKEPSSWSPFRKHKFGYSDQKFIQKHIFCSCFISRYSVSVPEEKVFCSSRVLFALLILFNTFCLRLQIDAPYRS